MEIEKFIREALKEDIGEGDHTSQATIPVSKLGKARLLVKDTGILSGVSIAEMIFNSVDPELKMDILLKDGNEINPGDIAFIIQGSVRNILKTERLVLNCMQRMSGIATVTAEYQKAVAGFNVKILDTRKTTPLLRMLEKIAVKTGGGLNHRMGLYDMILIKDNHVDSAGGIREALEMTKEYLQKNNLKIPVEIETRNLEEVKTAIECDIADRIMLDNFNPSDLTEAVKFIAGRAETEASGGITLSNIRSYAATGVNYISVGALTHSVRSLDLSLKIF